MNLKRIFPEKLNHLKGSLQKSKIFCLILVIVGALALTPVKAAAYDFNQEDIDTHITVPFGYNSDVAIYENNVLTDDILALDVGYQDGFNITNNKATYSSYTVALELANSDWESGLVTGTLQFDMIFKYWTSKTAEPISFKSYYSGYTSANTEPSSDPRRLFSFIRSGSSITDIVPSNVSLTKSHKTVTADESGNTQWYTFKFTFNNANVQDIPYILKSSCFRMILGTQFAGYYFTYPDFANFSGTLNFHDFIPGSGGGGSADGEGEAINPNLPDTTLPASDLSVQELLDTIVYGLNNARSINQIEAYLYMIKDLIESGQDIDFTPIIEALEDIQIDTSSIDDKLDEIIELLESLVPDSDDAAVVESAASGLASADANVDNSQKQILEDIDVADGAIETLADSANTAFAAQTQAISFWLLCLSTFKEYAAVFYTVIVVGLILGMIAFFLRRNG